MRLINTFLLLVVEFVPEFTGSQPAIKVMEGLKLIGYFTMYGDLPAGNKGFK